MNYVSNIEQQELKSKEFEVVKDVNSLLLTKELLNKSRKLTDPQTYSSYLSNKVVLQCIFYFTLQMIGMYLMHNETS